MQTLANETGAYSGGAAPTGKLIELTANLRLPGFVMAFTRNEEIFGEEESADFVYKVVSGAVRTVRVLSDGRRQVGVFHFAGDVFGAELGDSHRFSAEAVSDCQVALVRRTAVTRAAERDIGATLDLWTLASQDLQRLQDHMVLLSRKNASERVGAFLLDMAQRTCGGDAVELPMSRYDIADYLGLTIETVSRSFTQLEKDRTIALASSRSIVLRNRSALGGLHS